MSKRVVAIDLMSGDHGIEVSLPATLQHWKRNRNPELEYLLIGDQAQYQHYLDKHPDCHNFTFIHAGDIITMDDEPTKAIRKKDSSMRVMIQLIKEGRADGGISAGNTGALMMLSHLIIKPIEGISRTAICAAFPALLGKTWVLDLGANIICEPHNLYQFAVMAQALVQSVDQKKQPTISLLNVGSEAHKGNPLVQESAKLLEQSSLNYRGFIEGDTLFTNNSDIVVTDGFTGNSVLKACEGLARYIFQETKREVSKNYLNKLLSVLALPILLKMKNKYDPSNYNGASFLGFKKTVVKSHGGATVTGFMHAIDIAVSQIQSNLPNLIEEKMNVPGGAH